MNGVKLNVLLVAFAGISMVRMLLLLQGHPERNWQCIKYLRCTNSDLWAIANPHLYLVPVPFRSE